MPFIIDAILEDLTSFAGQVNRRVDIVETAEPTNYTLATTDGANSLGNELGLTITSITDGATDGRRVQTPAITDGDVTEDGTADWWAITDNSSIMHAAGDLSAPQVVTDLNKFTLDAISITHRDAT